MPLSMRRFHFTVFLIFQLCLLTNLLSGQAKKDSIALELGLEHAEIGVNYFFSNEIDSALHYSNLACKEFEALAAWEELVGTTNNLVFIYNQLYNYDKTEALSQQAYSIAKQHLPPSSVSFMDAASNMHQHYLLRGDFSKAISTLKEALKFAKEREASSLDLATIYENLGSSYSFSGDLERALSYYKKVLAIETDSFPNAPKLALPYQDIARAFQFSNQIDSAIFYYQKAEKLLRPIRQDNPLINNKIQVNLFLAELWAKKGNTAKAQNRIEKTASLKLDEYHQTFFAEAKAKVLFSQEKYSKAQLAFQKTQSLADQFNTYNTPPQQARRAAPWAQAHFEIGEYRTALTIYQKALNLLSPNDSMANAYDNPLANQLLDKPDALHLLKGKAAALYEISKTTAGLLHLKTAYQTYKTATQVISEIRQDILSITAKNSLAESSVPVFEGAIQCALELYVLTKDEKYKAAAFSLAEGNKAMLLLESINDQTAKGFAGIPDSILAKEQSLKSNLAFLKRTLLEKNKDPLVSKNIQDQLFQQQQILEQFTNDLESDFPRYHELKYKHKAVSIQQVQEQLKASRKVVLEYFFGEKNIYLFAITATNFTIHEIENIAEVQRALQELRNSLSSHPIRFAAQQHFNQYSQPAHFLYRKLLEPALSTIDPALNELIIIPDDQLNYLPFGVLLQQAPTSNTSGYSLEELDYLLEDYLINYQYSMTLRHKGLQRSKQNFPNNFIGFAPSFKSTAQIASRTCIADDLYSLQCSEQEVKTIASLLNGRSLVGPQANSQQFAAMAKDYRLLHLATHACVDESNARLNKIFLADNYFSNADLYHMDLRAELAVLSACNTGSGKLIKGEGVMSLARGFLNAGCASTVVSMWSVDDCATSNIMLTFYEALKGGQAKDKALQSAKLNYLQTAPKTKLHPYYWAPFVQFGDEASMSFGRRWPWGLIGGLGMALLYLLWRTIRKNL